MSRRRMVPVCLAIYGAAVLAVPLVVLSDRSDPRAPGPTAALEVTTEDAEPLADPLVGLWAEPVAEGHDRVRFYYFHGDGHGLYRYGRRSATFTNSFDYDVVGDVVELRFRKTGAEHAVHFAIESDDSGDRLVLSHDPRGDGSGVYVRTRREPVGHTDASPGLGGRMWLDRTSYATGGYGFALYQLRAAGIDGRGTGWFHRGDFDDWSTESLVYRIVGDRLELAFERTGEQHTSRFALEPGDPSMLVLEEDPRDWWHSHRYLDAGPAFGAEPTMLLPTPGEP